MLYHGSLQARAGSYEGCLQVHIYEGCTRVAACALIVEAHGKHPCAMCEIAAVLRHTLLLSHHRRRLSNHILMGMLPMQRCSE
jgi:hypothetical protein